MENNFLVVGHRGYSAIAPENTKLSFEAAYIYQFDGVELDIHLTKDNQLVIIHDEDLKRTSDGSGLINTFTLAELRKFNLASKFSNSVIRKQTIMTLTEFLELFGKKFKTINIEIKTDIIHYKGIESKLLETLNKVECSAEIVISAFNFKSLQILSQLDNHLNLGFLFVDDKDLLPVYDEVKKICKYIHPWFKSLENPRSLKVYYELGLGMNLWSFDKRQTGDEWTAGSNEFYKNIKNYKNIVSIIGNTLF